MRQHRSGNVGRALWRRADRSWSIDQNHMILERDLSACQRRVPSPACSTRGQQQPLSMGELIALLDSATGHLDGATGLTAAYRACNAAWCDAENLIDFVTVTSDVYPEPQAYCEEEEVEWLASFEAERTT